MPQPLLILFLKAPRPGFVKTRIAEKLGDEIAATIYRVMVTLLHTRLLGLREVELRFTPDDARAEIEERLFEEWTAQAQGQGDLGARLTRAFAEAFLRGSGRVVVIGSDCLELTETDIREAWAALDDHDLVVGPATDGGYWLIGLKEQHPELFADIAWSSPSVFEETIAIAKARDLKVHLLRTLSDIDTLEDWNAYLARQEQRESRHPPRPSGENRGRRGGR